MKLISWNVNGLRACLTHDFAASFAALDADVFSVQETKMQPGQADFAPEGYTEYTYSAEKKGYSGTACWCREQPLTVTAGIGIEEHDHEGRVLTLEYPAFWLVNCYTPNSQDGLKRLDYRMEWEDAFRAYLLALDAKKPVILCGDLNVAHTEMDIKNAKTNRMSAGFTDQDYRAQEEAPAPAPLPVAQQTTFSITPLAPAEEPQDIFDDPDTVRLDPVCVDPTTEPQKIAPAVQDILAQAGKEIVAFEAALQQHKHDPASDLPQEAQKMVGQTKVKAEFADEIEQLILPKFCLKIPQSILMPSDTQELTKENLLSNFTLKGKPSNIDFDHLDNNLAQVDLDGDGTPRASKMESQYQQFIGQQFPLMPGENRLKLCRNIIHTTLSRQKKLNAVDDTELQRYVDYIIDGMNQDQLDALEQMPINFANKICDYIIKLQEETARENFYNWLEVGKIVTEPRFKLTSHITLSGKASSLTKSLYKQECELDDNFEYDMAMALTGIDSVRWWHRNPTSGRNAFCLNAFRNHYPDFIVMTNSGKVLLVETKGDQLENAESREKIKLGRAWQNAAGSQYRYYMVFQNKDLHLEGAYRFDEFLKILGEL